MFLDRAIFPSAVRRPRFDHIWAEWPSTAENEVDERIAGATVVISSKIPLRGALLARHPSIRMIAIAGTGTDAIDLPYCREHGVVASNVRHYARHSVPEHAISLMLALRRNLVAYRADVEAGRWSDAPAFCLLTHPIGDLHGSRLGIVGDGVLGRGVAAIAQAFGMDVVYAEHRSGRTAHGTFLPLDELLATSDVVSLHCPLNDRTRGLMGAREFARMKPSALFINTARGGLVDEAALVEALRSGRIAGAGLDVVSSEPPRGGNPLIGLGLPNLIVTPHVAWASTGALAAMAEQLIENIELWAAGTPRHQVV
ncbi:MAG: D-2-hydroxyacid dehydrogenase [Burkholderiales bacterium]